MTSPTRQTDRRHRVAAIVKPFTQSLVALCYPVWQTTLWLATSVRSSVGTGKSWFRNFVNANEFIRIRVLLAFSGLSVVLPCLVGLGSYVDGTWELPGEGKGFTQHWGMWSFFVTTPLILIMLTLLLQRFYGTLTRDISRCCLGGNVPPSLRTSIDRHLQSLTLRTQLSAVFALMCIIGVYFAVLNVKHTIEPLSTYGNDVFDAYSYTYGFLTNKLYVFFVFGAVYPLVGYVIVHTAISLFLILREMQEDSILNIDFFHSDNCGGVSRFGTINLFVMAITMCILVVIFSLLETHAYRHRTTTLPLLCTSGFLILESVGTVYYLHKAVQQQRKDALQRVNDALNQSFVLLPRDEFPNHLLGVRTHLLGIKTYPYSGASRSVLNVIRTAPAIWGVIRLWV
jgi:hypothetical protein